MLVLPNVENTSLIILRFKNLVTILLADTVESLTKIFTGNKHRIFQQCAVNKAHKSSGHEFLCLLSSSTSEGEARGVHTGKGVVAVHARRLPH